MWGCVQTDLLKFTNIIIVFKWRDVTYEKQNVFNGEEVEFPAAEKFEQFLPSFALSSGKRLLVAIQ